MRNCFAGKGANAELQTSDKSAKDRNNGQNKNKISLRSRRFALSRRHELRLGWQREGAIENQKEKWRVGNGCIEHEYREKGN